MTSLQYYLWNGLPVQIEWFEAPPNGDIIVSDITSPAEHPTGRVPDGERHALVTLLMEKRRGWWASEKAVREHAVQIGPDFDESSVGIE